MRKLVCGNTKLLKQKRVSSFAETSTFRELDIIIRSESKMRILPGWAWPEKKQELLQLLDLSYQCIPVALEAEGIRWRYLITKLLAKLSQLVQALK